MMVHRKTNRNAEKIQSSNKLALTLSFMNKVNANCG